MRWILSLSIVLCALAAPHARAGGPEIAAALPLARHLAQTSGLKQAPTAELVKLVDQLTGRLMLDDEAAELDSASDLHRLVVLTVALEQLAERKESSPGLRMANVYAAHMVHTAGHAYETRPRTKAVIDGLAAAEKQPGTKHVLELLAQSVGAMRALGRTWFPNALHAALADDPKRASLHNLRGQWLAREGRLDPAVTALRQAVAGEPALRYGLNLHRALVEAGRADEAAALADKLVASAPGARGQLDATTRRHADQTKTTAFERPGAKPGLEASLEQLQRYVRMGRPEAAEVLAGALLKSHPDELRVTHAAAEVYASTRRFGRLRALLEAAALRGRLDRRLLEARIAAHAQARMDALRGSAAATQEAAALGDLETDLTRFVEVAGPAGDVVARSLRLFLTVVKATAAKAAQGDALPKLMASVERQVRLALEAHPTSGQMLNVVVGAWLSLKTPQETIDGVRKRLPKVAPAERPSIALLLARMEVGYGVRRRDAKLLRAGLKRLESLRPSPASQAAADYTRVAGRLALAALDGKGAGVAALAKQSLPVLQRLHDAFDVTDAAGRQLAVGSALSLAGTAFALRDGATAVLALRRARRLSGDPVLGALALGQALAIAGDDRGGFGLLDEALRRASRPALRFAAHKWVALAANRTGDLGVAEMALETLLKTWGEAKVPDRVASGVPMPVFLGDFNVEVGLAPGEPFGLRIDSAPLVVLLPDFEHDKAQMEALLETLRKK